MAIAHILSDKGSYVETVSETASVLAAAKRLTEKRIGAVLVTDAEDHVSGVLSERDIVRALANNGAAVLDMTAKSIMTAPVITCTQHATVQEVMAQMTSRRIRHLPVMDGDVMLGMVSIGDLVKARIEETEQEAAALKDYIVTG